MDSDEVQDIVRIRGRLTHLEELVAAIPDKTLREAWIKAVASIIDALYYPIGYPQVLEGDYGEVVARFEHVLEKTIDIQYDLRSLTELVDAAGEVVDAFVKLEGREMLVLDQMAFEFPLKLIPAAAAVENLELADMRRQLRELQEQTFVGERVPVGRASVRYQVFLSSTFADLQEERTRVTEAILKMGRVIPAGMELFGASSLPPWNVITRVLDVTDYFVLVLGNRYGSSPPGETISYTEMEYDYAISRNIPVLAFLADPNVKVQAQFVSAGRKDKMALNNFKDRVSANHTVTGWSEPHNLSQAVVTSLSRAFEEAPRPGWVRGVPTE